VCGGSHPISPDFSFGKGENSVKETIERR